jgi:NitT/TauT family transport system substrate-binding protein
MEGWKSYLESDPAPANALIKKDNPEMTDAILSHAVEGLKSYGLVTSGDAATQGIGAMTDARWKEFFDFAATAGLYAKDLDYKKAYDLRFFAKDVKP